jgi:hypothetical protein
MRRKTAVILAIAVLAGALLAIGLSALPAAGVSPSEQQCTSTGGTFTREGGTVSCTSTTTGKNDNFSGTTDTSGQGNINNQQTTSTTCSGTGSGKCPPGQF